MANKVIPTVIVDGPSKAVVHYYVESDGIEGELSRVTLLDPQEDFYRPVDKVSIEEIWVSFTGFHALLEFNALEPVPVWVLVPDASPEICFEEFGGLKDRSTAQSDGKLLMTTTDFAGAGNKGTFVIVFKKD